MNQPFNDQLVKRIQETVRTLQRSRQSVLAPIDTGEEKLRQSLRTLSRSHLSNLLRQLRAARGYSYETLASETGLSQQLLFDVEYKERRLSLDELRVLAACYRININDLLGIDID
ncbi:MAG: helix-turn-helix transcriptional regulator [Caldilineaceae bacterium]|nr:helix-turn-helix transcriptional regulator [Caldilineaceae bacterium]